MAIGEDSLNLSNETSSAVRANAADVPLVAGDLKIVSEFGDSGPSDNKSSAPSYDQQAICEQILLGIAMVNQISEFSEPIATKFSNDIIELQSLESIHKMLGLIKTVALDQLLFQRHIDKYECRQDLQERLQSNTDLVKQIFIHVLHSKITMTNLLVDGGVNSLKLLFSFAARLAAAAGGNDSNMRVFLAAYSCLQNKTSSMDDNIFGIIEPKESTNGNTKSILLGMKEYNEDRQRISKSNFKFLQQLSKEVLTPQDVVNLCHKIDQSVGRGSAMVGQLSAATKIFLAVAAHFASSNNGSEQKKLSVQHWEESTFLCAMSTFGDNLLTRITVNENFQKYFDAICANGKAICGANKIGNDKKVIFLHKSLNDFRQKYCSAVEATITKKDAFKFDEKFIHYENAIFIDWNPWRELIHTVDNVRSKLIADGVFKNAFNSNAKETVEFQKIIKILEHKYVEGIGEQNDGQEKHNGLGDKVQFWQNNVRATEKAGANVLEELEKIRAKFEQNVNEFEQNEMLF